MSTCRVRSHIMDTSTAISRRRLLRFIGGATLATVPVLGLTSQASAGSRMWCRYDPTFSVDGVIGNVYVSGELDQAYDVTGPVKLRFTLPEGSNFKLLATDAGFGQGYDISVEFDRSLKSDERSIAIDIEALVPAISDKLPILIEFVPDATIIVAAKQSGTTNKWLKVSTKPRKS